MLKFKKKLDLTKVISSPNVVNMLDKEDVVKIGQDVISKFDLDRESRNTWEELTQKALDLAELKHEMKHTPWPNASSVKYPLISTAVVQFASREYPELVRNDKVVSVKVCGEDPTGTKAERAQRISDHMSYQLLYEIEGWQADLDRMLHMLATVGICFKKTYYDTVNQSNVSQLCSFDTIFIHDEVKSLEKARRITHMLPMHRNDIVEASRKGIFIDIDDADDVTPSSDIKTLTQAELDRESMTSGQEDGIHTLLEQHRYLDLDGDGYEEPYIVTVDQDLGKVLRIVARWDEDGIELDENDVVQKIKPVQYFTDFHFIRSPRGSFYSLGFGQLLFSLNHSVNTILNQLIDAGTLATMPMMFLGKALRLPGGEYKMAPGKCTTVGMSSIDDMNKQIYKMDFNEPSPVLFQLLGSLIESAKDMSNSTDALLGKEQVQNVASTVALSQIEQGGKVQSAIHKRIVTSLTSELEKLFRLNRIFLDRQQYFNYLDTTQQISQDDYEDKSMDVKPVADPNIGSEQRRMATIQAIMEPITVIPNNGISVYDALHRYFTALQIPNIDKLLPPLDPNAPPPPEILKLQADLQAQGVELDIKKQAGDEHAKDVLIRAHKAEAEIVYLNAQTEKELANKDLLAAQAHMTEAQAVQIGAQPAIDYYKVQVDQLKAEAAIQKDIGDPMTSTSDADRAAMGQPEEGQMLPQPQQQQEVLPPDVSGGEDVPLI